ncbi:MAG: four helix bundle protein [Candidatus Uhrbacteria bacterium]|nr:four helix bundle protein [Patescibacteria group bacterium]MBU1906527.1 four helix bundle protein [Patescibacteria group bacterium]
MSFRYEDLVVGELVLDLIQKVYEITKDFPSDERFGLVSQIRRASVSVYLNIAEGTARNSGPDFARFINISRGSLMETHAGLKIAVRMGFLEPDRFYELQPRIQKIWVMLCSLRDSQHKSKSFK